MRDNLRHEEKKWPAFPLGSHRGRGQPLITVKDINSAQQFSVSALWTPGDRRSFAVGGSLVHLLECSAAVPPPPSATLVAPSHRTLPTAPRRLNHSLRRTLLLAQSQITKETVTCKHNDTSFQPIWNSSPVLLTDLILTLLSMMMKILGHLRNHRQELPNSQQIGHKPGTSEQRQRED